MSDNPAANTTGRGASTPSIAARLLGGDGVHLRDLPNESRLDGDPATRQGRYEIFGEIARGGIGIVLSGRDEELGRGVAVKVLQERHQDDLAVTQRFIEEAQIGGQLQHPGIVPIYDLGEHDGRPFFAMKLIRGRTLRAMLGERATPNDELPRLLTIFEAVCQTIGYAHARGVVHRDLKPDNVMVGQFGEVQVVDWGIAKVLDREPTARATPDAPSTAEAVETVRSREDTDTGQSLDGQVMGTPAYMPPEQARGETDRVDERSDVFGLGAILCETLTGQPPWQELLDAAIGEVDALHERLRTSGVDDELIRLACDCLAEHQDDRPANGKDVAERIAKYREGVEQRAREAMLHAAEARIRARATVWLAIAALVVIGLIAGGWAWSRYEQERRQRTAEGRLDTLVDEAAAAVHAARAAGWQQMDLWTDAVDSAERAVDAAAAEDVREVRRARARRDLESVRREQAAMVAVAERRHKEQAMLARLELVRIPTSERFQGEDWRPLESARLARTFLTAFSDYIDLDLTEAEPAAVVEALRGDIEVELAVNLDLLALAIGSVPQNAPERASAAAHNVRAIAGLLDNDDGWRSQLRELLATDRASRDRLEQLAANTAQLELPVASAQLLAESLLAVGADALAIQVYRRAHASHPQDFGMCYRIGVLHAIRTEWSQSAAYMRVARGLRPDIEAAEHMLAFALARDGQLIESREIFANLCERHPTDAHLLFHLAEAHFQLGDYEQARATLDDDVAAFSTDSDSLVLLARIAVRAQGNAAAVPLFERAVRADPRNAAARYRLGRTLAALGRDDEALPQLRAAAELRPDVPTTVQAAMAMVNSGDADQAVALLTDGLRRHPQSAVLHATMGNAQLGRSQLEPALQSYRRALAIGGEDGVAHAGIARALEASGQPAAALTEYRKALRARRNDPLADVEIIRLQIQLGQPAAAAAHARNVLADDNVSADVLVKIGARLTDADVPALGERAFRRALAQRDDPHFRYLLGNALIGQSRYREAVTELRAAVTKRPEHVRAWCNLLIVLEHCDHLGDAVAAAEAAVQALPDVRVLHQFLASHRAEVGLLADAEAALAAANRIDAANRPQPRGLPQVSLADTAAAVAEAAGALPALREFVLGDAVTSDELSLIDAAVLALRMDRYRRATTLFERGLRSERKPGAFVLVAAARAALLTQALEGARPDERARLRAVALGWLQAVLAQGDDGRRQLTRWQRRGDFDSVRGPDLKSLPDRERSQWQAIWRELAPRRR